MKLAATGDLHDNLRHFIKVIEDINSKNIDVVAFTGDFDMPFCMRAFTKLNCPVKAVLGNGDPDIQKFEFQMQNLPELKGLKLDISPRVQDFMLDGKRIAIFHGDDENLIKILLDCQFFDLLCIGHSHIPEIKKEGKTTILNPGSMVGWMLEKGDMPITYGIYDTIKNSAEIISIDLFK